MGLRVEIRMEGMDTLTGRIDAMAGWFRRPDWRPVQDYLLRAVADQFSSEGRRFDTPWAPLNPAYRARKARDGYSTQILVRTGRMKGKFMERRGVQRTANGIRLRWNLPPYAIFHQEGTSRMPARPIVKVTPRDEQAIRDMMADQLQARWSR